jgi:hypothetical protein
LSDCLLDAKPGNCQKDTASVRYYYDRKQKNCVTFRCTP